jgi:protein-S-isoprenylcysteine O-methyltransferase Ste14
MVLRPGASAFPARACPGRMLPDGRHLTPCENFTMMMTSVRVMRGLGGTAAYLGLAMLGEGGWTSFCAHPARVVLAVVLAALAGVSLFADGNLSPGVREDRGNRWIIGALTLIGLLATSLPAYTDRKACWTLDGDTMRGLGVGLFAAGGALRLWPVFVLGRRFSGLVALQPGHTLVTSGVYGVIRHPSSLGWLVNALGWDLAFRAGVGVLLTALMIPPLLARIRAEARLLRTQFGDEYGAYCARTARLLPGLYERGARRLLLILGASLRCSGTCRTIHACMRVCHACQEGMHDKPTHARFWPCVDTPSLVQVIRGIRRKDARHALFLINRRYRQFHLSIATSCRHNLSLRGTENG